MKKRKYFIVSLLFTGIVLFVLYSCTKEDEIQKTEDRSSNVLVYEDQSTKDKVSPYFYDNHIYRIELLGDNQERAQIVREVLSNGVDEGFLMVEEAQKFFFNHTGVIMYSIPTRDPEQTLIIYETKGLFQVSMANYRPVEGGKIYFALKTMDDREYLSLKLDDQNRLGELKFFEIYFALKTMDDREYLSLKLDDQNRLGELKFFENEKLKSYNRAVYSITLREESQVGAVKDASAICCRKESSWSDCMTCTANDCASSWLCKVVAIIAPKELIASLAVSCIGAGPDSIC